MRNNTTMIINNRMNKNSMLSKYFFSLLIFSIILSYPAIALDYESLLNSQIKPNTLIIFSGNVNDIENYFKGKDIIPMHIFPSESLSAMIVYQPQYVEDSVIIENGNVVKIFHEAVSLDMVQEYGNEIVYAVVAFDNFIGKPIVNSAISSNVNPSFVQNNDLLIPSDYDFATGRAGIDIGPNGGPTQQETSLFMIGKSSVTVVLPESNGSIDPNTENWNTTEIYQVVQEVTNGTNWYLIREPRARLSFVYRFYAQLPTSYEPINRPSTDECLWINQIAQQFGYYSGTDCSTNVRNANHAIRTQDNSDWGYTIFVVDSSNDLDGSFSNGQSAYAYLAGPFIVMTYDNGGWGINNMDAVTAHEMGHSFQALDQYLAQIPNSPSCNPNNVNTQCTQTSGFLNIENQNCEISSCLLNQPSIMKYHNVAYPSGTIDVYGRGQLGWRDQNNDNILDSIQTPYNSGPDADGDTITNYWDDCPNEYALQGFGCPTTPYFSWLNNTRLTFNNFHSIEPTIAVDSFGNSHIVWTDLRDAVSGCNTFDPICNAEIYYTKLDRFGNTLVDDLRLTYSNLASVDVFSHKPALAIDAQNNLHLVWQEGRYSSVLKYAKLSNNGVVLVNKTILGGSSGYYTFPSIAVDSLGNVQVFSSVWPPSPITIHHTKLNNSGDTIVYPHYYVISPPGYDDYSPSISIDNQNKVHMVWGAYNYNGPFGAHVRYAKFDEQGNIITNKVISPNYDADIPYRPPKIKTDYLGNAHIVWSTSTYNFPLLSSSIYYTKLNNSGDFIVNASRLINISSYSSLIYAPSMAIDGLNNIDIMWWFQYGVNNYSLYHTKLNQNLFSIISPYIITNTNISSGISTLLPPPIFTYFSGNLHVSFIKKVSVGNTEVYYKRSFSQPSIFTEGLPSLGSTIKFHIVDSNHPGAPYFLALAFGTYPGLVLPDGRAIPLNYDSLLLTSLNSPGSIGLSNNIGYLNNNGYANVTLAIPNNPSLVGQTFYAGFITVNSAGTQILGISPAVNVTIS